MDESHREVSLASASLRNPQAPVVASVRATPRTPPSSTHLFLFLSPPGFSPASHVESVVMRVLLISIICAFHSQVVL